MKTIGTTLTFVCFSLILIGTLQSFAKIDPETCFGLWLFDEGKGDVAEDSSGKGNNGTLMNGTKWVNGQFGKALEFDGKDDYLDCGIDASLETPDEVTVTAWVKANSLASTDWGPMISSRYGGNWKGWALYLPGTEGKPAFRVLTPQIAYGALSPTPISLGSWYHFCGVWNGSQVCIYVNGQLVLCQINSDKFCRVGSAHRVWSFGGHCPPYNDCQNKFYSVLGDKKDAPKMTTEVSRILTIGKDSWAELGHFNGAIDEVAVFKVALTENDVKRITDKGLERALGMTAVSPSGKLTTTWSTIKINKYILN